jgi:hypothetical protein
MRQSPAGLTKPDYDRVAAEQGNAGRIDRDVDAHDRGGLPSEVGGLTLCIV